MQRPDATADFAASLAGLLRGLHQRGMAVGVDDAARVAVAFRHATGWNHARRVRVLKALLAKTEEERRLIDRLSPFLFIRTELRSQRTRSPVRALTGLTQELKLPPGRPGPDLEDDVEEVPEPEAPERPPAEPPAPRRARWVYAAVVVALLAVVGVVGMSLDPPGSTVAGEGVAAGAAPGAPLACPLVPRPPLPAWPFALIALACLAGATPVLLYLLRAWQQRRSVVRLARSPGPRTYEVCHRPDLPPAPIPADPLREAAYHLAAPRAEGDVTSLDVEETVRATVERAGRLTLRRASRRESRRVLVIEDVGPSMCRWPDHGRQVHESLVRQGSDVERWYMDGTPERLSRSPDLLGRVPLDQVIAALSHPVVVVVSDAAALDRVRGRREAAWTESLHGATWLHPRPPELWGSGARWLVHRLPVVPLGTGALLRLARRADSTVEGVRAWAPARPCSLDLAATLAAWRISIGEAAFRWLAAGAVLARAGMLDTRLWWELALEGITPARWHEIERVWELPGIRVGGDGAVRMRPDLQEELVRRLRSLDRPLLRRVVEWAVSRIDEDLASLPDRCAAAVEGRVLRARLLLEDRERRSEARRAVVALGVDGFGGLLGSVKDDFEAAGIVVETGRARPPAPRVLAAAAVGGLLCLVGGVLAVDDEVREGLQGTREPRFELLAPAGVPTVFPGRPLHFCDAHGSDETPGEVHVAVGDEQAVLAQGGGGRWRIRADDPRWAGLVGKGPVPLRVGYGSPAGQVTWQVRLEELVRLELTARVDPEVPAAHVRWSVPERVRDSAPDRWQVYVAGEAAGTVESPAWSGWREGPEVWTVRVEGTGSDGRPFSSDSLEVRPGLLDAPPDPVRLTARYREGNAVALQWAAEGPAAGEAPEEWTLERDGKVLDRVTGSQATDRPSGDGPWSYRVRARAWTGRRFEGGPVEVRAVGWLLVSAAVRPGAVLRVGGYGSCTTPCKAPLPLPRNRYRAQITLGKSCRWEAWATVRPGKRVPLAPDAACLLR